MQYNITYYSSNINKQHSEDPGHLSLKVKGRETRMNPKKRLIKIMQGFGADIPRIPLINLEIDQLETD